MGAPASEADARRRAVDPQDGVLAEPRLVSASDRLDPGAALGIGSRVKQDQDERPLADDRVAVPELAAPHQERQPVGESRRDLRFDEGRELVLGDGGLAYFIGLVADSAFSSAQIGFDDGAGNFLFNVDDITVAPEPRFSLILLNVLVIVAGILRGRIGRSSE